ncbi:hypothetical protein [Pseudomonas syringae]|uniref:Uncharacterized protein n=1 Tax=Pseudomonas syringae pv. papulans TaxID=83963 RepID=A0AA43IVS6_PSESX|nr:hypothetical protein [Pseudomonas syringae]KWS33178.1 hypothetical protein AL059_12195 [Pseudomonas syringae pv. papulans]MDH4604588.1 hypothetical protein [Pseudomonas syringae pv. papulans]MDH4623791.1 hypothetical protein [Pseudomonas syringae pv. papulans]RMV50023.1 hypothetical protein ALP11_00242 [Pseudomonas syringae pv. papulans]
MTTRYVVTDVPRVEVRGVKNGIHSPPISAAKRWFMIQDTHTGGSIGDGYEDREEAAAHCERLNEKFKS